MGWVVQTLVKIFLMAACGLFGELAKDFIGIFGINIGADFPTIANSSKSLDAVLRSYGTKTSTFDALFDMSTFKTIFGIMALTIATALFAKELFLAITSPLGAGKRQSAPTSVFNYIKSVIGILLSYRLFIVVEYMMNEFYIKIGKAAIDAMNFSTGSKNTLEDITKGSAEGGKLVSVLNQSNFIPMTNEALGIGELILNLIIVYLLLVNLLKLFLEILERYIVLGVLFYTSPLAFSTIASNDTVDIFKSWVRMSISQMILIATNSIFIAIFFGALWRMSNIFDGVKLGEDALVASSRLSWMVYMLLLLAWLLFAQRLDSYLNSLGLSTAQTGGSLGSAVMLGATAVGGFGAKMGKKAWDSSLGRAARSSLNPAKQYENLGKTAKNTIQDKGGKLAGKLTGDEKMQQSSKQAHNRNEGIQTAADMGKNFAAQGDREAAKNIKDLAYNGNLSAQGANNLGSALKGKVGNSNTNKMLANGENFSASADKNGVPSLSFKANGGNGTLSFGGPAEGKTLAGTYGNTNLYASGDEKFMRGIVGDSAINSATASRAEQVGGASGWTGNGLGSGAVLHADGSGEKILPAGATVTGGASVTDLGNGFKAVEYGAGKHSAGGSFGSLDFVSNARVSQAAILTASAAELSYDLRSFLSGHPQSEPMAMEHRQQYAELTGMNGGLANLFLDRQNDVYANGDGSFRIHSNATGADYVLDTLDCPPGYSQISGNFNGMYIHSAGASDGSYSDGQLLEMAMLSDAGGIEQKDIQGFMDMFEYGGNADDVKFYSPMENQEFHWDNMPMSGVVGTIEAAGTQYSDRVTTKEIAEMLPEWDDGNWVQASSGIWAHLTEAGRNAYNATYNNTYQTD